MEEMENTVLKKEVCLLWCPFLNLKALGLGDMSVAVDDSTDYSHPSPSCLHPRVLYFEGFLVLFSWLW